MIYLSPTRIEYIGKRKPKPELTAGIKINAGLHRDLPEVLQVLIKSGKLTVDPKTAETPFEAWKGVTGSLWKWASYEGQKLRLKAKAVEAEAGDLFIFNTNLPHEIVKNKSGYPHIRTYCCMKAAQLSPRGTILDWDLPGPVPFEGKAAYDNLMPPETFPHGVQLGYQDRYPASHFLPGFAVHSRRNELGRFLLGYRSWQTREGRSLQSELNDPKRFPLAAERLIRQFFDGVKPYG